MGVDEVVKKIGFNTQPPEGGWLMFDYYVADGTLFQHTAARRRLDTRGGFSMAKKRFQHTAARRRLGSKPVKAAKPLIVSTHSRPKAAGACAFVSGLRSKFQHTAARRRLENGDGKKGAALGVSTHSRPKAAGQPICPEWLSHCSFNTQPPEGGWSKTIPKIPQISGFNTQPPEGGWTQQGA